MKFHVLVFGCQMNYADAARIKAVMINCGFEYSTNIEDADIVIFDTCSVRQKSEDKITGKLKEIPKNKKIWITGCMIQHNFRNAKVSSQIKDKKITGLMKKGNFLGTLKTLDPEIIGIENQDFKELNKTNKEQEQLFINHAFNPLFVNLQKKFHNLELFLRIDDLGFLPIILPKLGYKVSSTTEQTNEYAQIIPSFQNKEQDFENPATAYIPISTGCNQFCSFCIVPYARGLEKYFPVEQIVQEAKHHLASGAQEIVLLGQIVNKHPEFNIIIKEVLKLEGLKWLRYTSPYPTYYNDELFKLHEQEPKLCPHIHIPVQSGSNHMLKKMFRGYTIEQFKEFIDKIQALQRPISITTDIIVGFPTETEQDFQDTLDITSYSKFDMIYIGIYSPRKGTYADQKMEDDIPYATKHARRDQLNNLLVEISSQNNKAEEGTTKTVLIDGSFEKNGKTYYTGHTDNMKTIEIQSQQSLQKGQFVQAKVTHSQSLKLFGETTVQD